MFDKSEKIKCCEINKIQTESWKDMKNKVFEVINNCCSISRLKNSRFIFKSLIEHINQSRLFFRCESNSVNTQITVLLLDEKFMSIIVNEKMSDVPEYMQEEISKMLKELCESAIECIDKRIPVIEQKNKVQKKRDKLIFVTLIPVIAVMSLFSTYISEKTTALSESGSDEMKFFMGIAVGISTLIKVLSLITIVIIPLRWFIEDKS